MKEGGISARKSDQIWGLSMKKSTLQIRLNGRATFDLPLRALLQYFFKQNIKIIKKWFTDWLIELANRGFGSSMDAFSNPNKSL